MDTFNYLLSGVSSNVQFGKGGGILDFSNGIFLFTLADGLTAVPVSVGTPTNTTHATTKSYVDSAVSSVANTTSNILAMIQATNIGAGLDTTSGAYVPNISAYFTNNAVSLMDANNKLDASIYSVTNAIGLTTSLTYTPYASGNYIAAATSLYDADELLDAAIYANTTLISTNSTIISTIETSVGLTSTGTKGDYSSTNYILNADSIVTAIGKLDAAIVSGTMGGGSVIIIASGAVTGTSAESDGTLTLPLTLAASGVTPGTYTSVVVNESGLVISGGMITASQIDTALGFTPASTTQVTGLGTTLSTSLISSGFNPDGTKPAYSSTLIIESTDTLVTAIGKLDAATGTISSNITVDATGDVTGTATSINGTLTLPLTLAASGVTAGTYTKVTVSANGLVTSATDLLASDIENALGYTPADSSTISTLDTEVGNIIASSGLNLDGTNPGYSSTNYILDTDPLVSAIGKLDAQLRVEANEFLPLTGGTLTGNVTVTGTASLASVAVTGTATVMTVTSTDNSTNIATTAFVQNQGIQTGFMSSGFETNGSKGTYSSTNYILDADSLLIAIGKLDAQLEITTSEIGAATTSGTASLGTLTIDATGAVTGTGTSANGTLILPLVLAASGVTPGTFTKVIVTSSGVVTSGLSLVASDISTALGYMPGNPASSAITGGTINGVTIGATTPGTIFGTVITSKGSLIAGASYANGMSFVGAATTMPPIISAFGTDTNIGLDYVTKGTGLHSFATANGTVLSLSDGGITTIVNNIQIVGTHTGSPVIIQATGTDGNIGMNYNTKGTGVHTFTGGVAIAGGNINNTVIGATTPAAATLTTVVANTSVSVGNGSANYLFLNGAASGSEPSISATGSDANVGLNLSFRGTGGLMISNSSGEILSANYSAFVVNAAASFSQGMSVVGSTNFYYDDAGTNVMIGSVIGGSAGNSAWTLDTSFAGEIRLEATSSSTADVNVRLVPQGTGTVIFGVTGNGIIQADDGYDLDVAGGDSTTGAGGNLVLRPGNGTTQNGVINIEDGSSNLIALLSGTVSPTSYLTLENGITSVNIGVAGSTSNINLDIAALGTGTINLGSDTVVTGNLTTNGFLASQMTATYAATMTLDLFNESNYSITLTGDVTFANPTTLAPGSTGKIVLIQGSTGGYTSTFDTAWLFAGGIAPTLTATAGAIDILSYYAISSTQISCTYQLNFTA